VADTCSALGPEISASEMLRRPMAITPGLLPPCDRLRGRKSSSSGTPTYIQAASQRSRRLSAGQSAVGTPTIIAASVGAHLRS